MKKKNQNGKKKLSLQKLQMAKINNPRIVMGGSKANGGIGGNQTGDNNTDQTLFPETSYNP
ncbi:hypothetical protein HIO71_05030 [Chryseobacterium aquaticum]|uniref:Uncharacterized protein n=1 Tax=Chryseobacterium aquaticum TaxID=452084 RepID=A0A848N599_9FLAO|nr:MULTISPECIES: hypothetical protein [Chryseobacterium]NMR33569.1 hypothetical protein [Chryseobacterium aquaticum]NRQ45643.1 hypothetical protein [Chryseobacterium sp. C-204]